MLFLPSISYQKPFLYIIYIIILVSIIRCCSFIHNGMCILMIYSVTFFGWLAQEMKIFKWSHDYTFSRVRNVDFKENIPKARIVRVVVLVRYLQ